LCLEARDVGTDDRLENNLAGAGGRRKARPERCRGGVPLSVGEELSTRSMPENVVPPPRRAARSPEQLSDNFRDQLRRDLA
jgi:hypothetical protein